MPAAAVGGAEGVGWFLNFDFSLLVSDATTNGGSKLRGHNGGEERAGPEHKHLSVRLQLCCLIELFSWLVRMQYRL